MKRILTLSALAIASLSLVNCASEPQVIHEHHYYTNTRSVPARTTSASVPTYKPAGVVGNSPESFEAVTPPSSYSR